MHSALDCEVTLFVRFAKQFNGTMLQCLDSTNVGIVESSLKNLAEFAVLSQGISKQQYLMVLLQIYSRTSACSFISMHSNLPFLSYRLLTLHIALPRICVIVYGVLFQMVICCRILQYPGNGFTCYIVITDHLMVEVEQLIWCACLFLDSNLTFKRYLAWWTLVLPKFEGHSSRHEKNKR